MSRRGLVPALVVSLVLAGCAPAPVHFVDGPEAADLADRITGHLVLKQSRDTTGNDPRVAVLALPARQRSVVRRYAEGSPQGRWIETVSGPDRRGRIAFVEELGFQSGRYAVKSIGLDGTGEQELFHVHDGGVSETLSVSPSGERIAYVGPLTRTQMPKALLETGPLEVWHRGRNAVTRFDATALTAPPSWFPDGTRLALSELVPRHAIAAEIERGLGAEPDFLKGVESWDRLPVVYVLDVDTGRKTLVHLGWRPLVSVDGRTIVFRWGAYRLFDVAAGTSRRARWPGSWLPPIALLPGDLVIYPGLPTRGTEVRRSQYGSFSWGSPLGSIKVADLRTGRFQTLVDYADGREKFSFGAVPPGTGLTGRR